MLILICTIILGLSIHKLIKFKKNILETLKASKSACQTHVFDDYKDSFRIYLKNAYNKYKFNYNIIFPFLLINLIVLYFRMEWHILEDLKEYDINIFPGLVKIIEQEQEYNRRMQM